MIHGFVALTHRGDFACCTEMAAVTASHSFFPCSGD
jgi:hypothetical protein